LLRRIFELRNHVFDKFHSKYRYSAAVAVFIRETKDLTTIRISRPSDC